jgi:hypothetical protein
LIIFLSGIWSGLGCAGFRYSFWVLAHSRINSCAFLSPWFTAILSSPGLRWRRLMCVTLFLLLLIQDSLGFYQASFHFLI